MQERPGTFFGVVLSVVLTVLIGVNQAHVQTTSTAAVDVTFPGGHTGLCLTGSGTENCMTLAPLVGSPFGACYAYGEHLARRTYLCHIQRPQSSSIPRPAEMR
jgi:hypothetical protein